MHKRALVLLAVVLLPVWGVLAAPAQQTTVPLRNAGFEEGTTNGWSWWNIPEKVIPGDINNSWYNPFFVPNSDPKRIRSGSRALEINNEYRKWRAGTFQTVDVAAGSRVVFKVWVQGYTNTGEFMIARAGIDPNGGVDAFSSAVLWSGVASVGESYVQLASPEVVVGPGGKVTVFTWGEPPSPAPKTAIFFDDATLEVLGQAQPTSAPPAQPTQPPAPRVEPITPAQPQPDGSIVYTVKSGDTLFAIALAHNTTVDNIMQLNGMSSTLISVGQKLIIRRPTVPPTATVPPTPVVPPTPTFTPVPPTGKICILAFNDRDGNGVAGGVGEDLLPGVVFALSSAQSAPRNYTTDGLNEPYCFTDLLPDTYTLKIVPPAGYSATTPEVWSLGVAGGQQVDISFGAKKGGAAPTPPPTSSPTPGGGSSFLAAAGRIIGGILAIVVLIGLGAAAMYFFQRRAARL